MEKNNKEKPNLYNDLHPDKSLKNTGFKDKIIAINTIKNVSSRSLKYQFDVINTMYNRAKFHPHQTPDMQKAMEIFSSWLKKYNKKKQLENKKFQWLSFQIINKYEKINMEYNILVNNKNIENCKKFLSIYKKFKNKIYKLQYIPIKINNEIYDYWSYRIKFIKKKLKQMEKLNIKLYYKTGKYKDLPTSHHIELILHGFSPDKNLYNIYTF